MNGKKRTLKIANGEKWTRADETVSKDREFLNFLNLNKDERGL